MTSFIREKINDLFGIDVRSLALFRMALAVLVILDLSLRAIYLVDHYTEFGVYPVSLARIHADPGTWSIHFLNDSIPFEIFLFCFTGLCALSLLVGYQTKLSTFLLWFLIASLHARTPLVLAREDHMLPPLIFWSMFLPLGAKWSLDQIYNPHKKSSEVRICSMGSAAILLQVGMVYLFFALYKMNPYWLKSLGLACALQYDEYVTAFGKSLLQYPEFLRWLGKTNIAYEFLIFLFAFSPWYTQQLRRVVIVGVIVFHFGMDVIFEFRTFASTCLVAWMLFLPTSLWDKILPSGAERKETDIPKRNRFAKFYRNNSERLGIISIVSSIFILGERWIIPRSSVVKFLNVWKRGILLSLIRKFGWKQYIVRPTDKFRINSFFDAVCLFFLLYMILYNIGGLIEYRYYGKDKFAAFNRFRWLGQTTMLEQRWTKFHAPPRQKQRYIVTAKLFDNREIDVFTGKPVSWLKPEILSKTAPYKEPHWNLYYLRMNSKDMYFTLARYYCRRLSHSEYPFAPLTASHNSAQSESFKVKSVNIYSMAETADGVTFSGKEQKTRLLEWDCCKNEALDDRMPVSNF